MSPEIIAAVERIQAAQKRSGELRERTSALNTLWKQHDKEVNEAWDEIDEAERALMKLLRPEAANATS